MTDFKSVMYFDRELIYRTQNEEDAIGFVNVAEVEESLLGGQLPEWETVGVAEKKDKSGDDVYSELLSTFTKKETHNKKLTFQPGHRNTHLALKRLYATNKINELIKETEKTAATLDERKLIFTEKLKQLVSNVVNIYLPNLYHPLIEKKQQLASDVYHESHPFIKMCVHTQKRKADSFQEPEGKRICN